MEKRRHRSHQRERIYEYLIQSSEHPSAETIHNDLRREFPGLSLGTVYRNLKLLEELGSVRRAASFQGTERYDAICEDHPHFLCECCGMLQDLEHVGAEVLKPVLRLQDGFVLKKLNVTVVGLCPNCI